MGTKRITDKERASQSRRKWARAGREQLRDGRDPDARTGELDLMDTRLLEKTLFSSTCWKFPKNVLIVGSKSEKFHSKN